MSPTIAYGPPVITIDVEDWPQSTWDQTLPITDRAAINTRRVLGLLRETGVRATMFVLGKFAERFPEVVRQIHTEGHEVACHGYGHMPITGQSRHDFLADVLRAKDLLEQTVGERVRGYRAPDFTIVSKTLWALEALGEAGFEYDSSIVPVRLARYGIPEWPVTPMQLRFGTGGTIMEVPLATFRCLGKNWPVGGGGTTACSRGLSAGFLRARSWSQAPLCSTVTPMNSICGNCARFRCHSRCAFDSIRALAGDGLNSVSGPSSSGLADSGCRICSLRADGRNLTTTTFARKLSSNSIPDLGLSSIREA